MAGQAKAHPVPRETGHNYRRGQLMMFKASQTQGLGSISSEQALSVGTEHVTLTQCCG